MNERNEFMAADKSVVFDLMDHLRKSFEDFCNTYHKEIPYLDAFMGVHNFHKMIVMDIAARSNLKGPAKAIFLKLNRDTFDKAIDEAIEKALVEGQQN